MAEMIAAVRMMKRSACPRCGAKTEKQAERMCSPQPLADTGDYTCPTESAQVDAQGWFLGPTKAAEEADAAYWHEMGLKMEAEIEATEHALMLDRRMPPTATTGLPYYGCPDDWSRLPGVIAFNQPQEPTR